MDYARNPDGNTCDLLADSDHLYHFNQNRFPSNTRPLPCVHATAEDARAVIAIIHHGSPSLSIYSPEKQQLYQELYALFISFGPLLPAVHQLISVLNRTQKPGAPDASNILQRLIQCTEFVRRTISPNHLNSSDLRYIQETLFVKPDYGLGLALGWIHYLIKDVDEAVYNNILQDIRALSDLVKKAAGVWQKFYEPQKGN